MTSSISEAIAAEARQLGFATVGILHASRAPDNMARLREWIDAGCHGDMLWMADTLERRASPIGLWPEVRSILMLGFPYTPPLDPMRNIGKGKIGNISVYALGRDYHDLVKSRLKALARWMVARSDNPLKVFVDTAPVMEKPLAAAAGIGWQGKHSNLLSRKHGNWLFLGSVYTTDLLPELTDSGAVGQCGSCAACMTACPTGAIHAPYRVDARACISYLTIEHKGPIPERYRRAMGNRIYGCDDCLAVCPWNRFAHVPAEAPLLPRAELAAPMLTAFLGLDDAGFRDVFRGSPVKRVGRDRFVRNCLIAAGNSGAADLLAPVAHLLSDDSWLVRDAAQWALHELRSLSQCRKNI